MNLFFVNLFIALGYMGVQGQFSLYGLGTGFLLGYLALWITPVSYTHLRAHET